MIIVLRMVIVIETAIEIRKAVTFAIGMKITIVIVRAIK